MEKFGRSQPVRRREDVRFLTGAGRYIDDTAPADALFAVFLRAPVAHAVIAALDVSAARAMPGVAAVLTAADLEAAGVILPMKAERVKLADGTRGAAPVRPVLARGRVRFVGEPVAIVLADTIAAAKDAVEAIGLETEDLPVALGLAEGGPEIHPEAPGNVAFRYRLGDGAAVDAALAAAAHVVRLTVEDNRVIVNAMEPRGVWAAMEGERLHVAVNGQGVWGPRDDIAHHLRLPKSAVRVTTPDVGGGFGMKGMSYPEMIAVAAAARITGRPVRWMAERTESMLSDNAGRDLVTEVTMAFDGDLRLTGYRTESRCNLGAYNSAFAQMIQTELFSKVLTGTYAVPAAEMRCTGLYTNTTPVDAYRGAGRPEAIFVLERSMDHAARALGVDPWELRRRNFIPPARFPYTTPMRVTYDVGEFARVLGVAETAADRAGLAARKAASAAAGRLRGQGLCYYIESILGDKDETARVVFRADGRVELHVGTQSNGQGHETVYAQFLSDQSGIPADLIEVVQGDSDRIPKGGGTGGSRSVTVQNTATLGAVAQIVAAFRSFLAAREGVAAEEIVWDDERFRIPGSNLSPTLLEVAALARAEGRTDLLDQSATIELDDRSFPNGAHVAEVEIDPETGEVTLDRYTVVDDFGNLINPMLAEGQVHGGVAQGAGQALLEQVAFDAQGQLLTATFMDYAMPRADSLPFLSFTSVPVPSRNNPMGMKGCGEAGTVGALAAIANAVQDALWERGVRDPQMPYTPRRVWEMLQAA